MRNLKLFLIKLFFNDIYSEQQEIINRQRRIIEISEDTIKDVINILENVYLISQETHSMTGASER